MSRNALQELVHACERSPSLRQSLKACGSPEEWIAVARGHGFLITSKDLEADDRESELSDWFEQSRINQPFRSRHR